MIDPFIAFSIDVILGAKRHRIGDVFRALVDHGASFPAERPAVQIRLDEVLIYFGTNFFQKVAAMTDHRKISSYGVLALKDIGQAEQEKRNEKAEQEGDRMPKVAAYSNQDKQECRDDKELVSHLICDGYLSVATKASYAGASISSERADG